MEETRQREGKEQGAQAGCESVRVYARVKKQARCEGRLRVREGVREGEGKEQGAQAGCECKRG